MHQYKYQHSWVNNITLPTQTTDFYLIADTHDVGFVENRYDGKSFLFPKFYSHSHLPSFPFRPESHGIPVVSIICTSLVTSALRQSHESTRYKQRILLALTDFTEIWHLFTVRRCTVATYFAKIRHCLPELWKCIQWFTFFSGHSVYCTRIYYSFSYIL